MKYSMNYYPKRKREFQDSYSQNPGIFETITGKERKKTIEIETEQKRGNFEFVVPWQLH